MICPSPTPTNKMDKLDGRIISSNAGDRFIGDDDRNSCNAHDVVVGLVVLLLPEVYQYIILQSVLDGAVMYNGGESGAAQ